MHPQRTQSISTQSFIRKVAPETIAVNPTSITLPVNVSKTYKSSVSVKPTPQTVAAPQTALVYASPVVPGETLSVAALLGTVNGQPLFVQDILNPISVALRHEATTSRTESYFRQRAQNSIYAEIHAKISNMLLYKAAHQQLSKDDHKRIKMYVQAKREKILSQYMGSASLANRELELAGTSLNKKLYDLRRQVTIQLYLQKLTFPEMVVTRRDILHYYKAHLENFTRHAEIDLYTITYPVVRQWPRDPDDSSHTKPITHPTAVQIAAARREAIAYCEHLESRIRKGANFAFLAEDNSVDYEADNGGHWPHTRRGELANPLIEKVAFSLKPGSMADPILIKDPGDPRRDTVVIIRVTRVVPHRVIPFSIAQNAIAKKLRLRLYRKLVAGYYRHLYDTASIAALDQMVQTATNVAVSLYWMK